MSKVFAIGFHKTGTSSLGKAFEILGYKSCFGANELRAQLGEMKMMQSLFKEDYEEIFKFAEAYDCFNDLPWFAIYKALDLRFPNSKFILTTREESAWINSSKAYFGDTTSPFRLWLYGKSNPKNDQEVYLKRYQEHNKEVESYFEDRNDLLILPIEEKNKWNQLCSFLNKAIPQEDYPLHNLKGKR